MGMVQSFAFRKFNINTHGQLRTSTLADASGICSDVSCSVNLGNESSEGAQPCYTHLLECVLLSDPNIQADHRSQQRANISSRHTARSTINTRLGDSSYFGGALRSTH